MQQVEYEILKIPETSGFRAKDSQLNSKGRQPQACQRSQTPGGIFMVSYRQPSYASPKPEEIRGIL